MSEDPEPARNISGGTAGGGRQSGFRDVETETRAAAVVRRLGDLYWQKTYGDRSAFDCLVRTILSQNTSDKASQPAYDELVDQFGGESVDLAKSLAHAEQADVADAIASAGLYNQKSETLIRVADRVLAEYGSEDEFDRFVREGDPGAVREALLDFKGVGPKTADCVLLFAGGREGVFPVDTHVHRIYRRLGIAPPDADHEAVRAVLERDVPPEWCGFGHTASIQFGREYCSARKPACLEGTDECPMSDLCDRVGVDVETGTVVDPAEVDATGTE
jgi:endonuclease-3